MLWIIRHSSFVKGLLCLLLVNGFPVFSMSEKKPETFWNKNKRSIIAATAVLGSGAVAYGSSNFFSGINQLNNIRYLHRDNPVKEPAGKPVEPPAPKPLDHHAPVEPEVFKPVTPSVEKKPKGYYFVEPLKESPLYPKEFVDVKARSSSLWTGDSAFNVKVSSEWAAGERDIPLAFKLSTGKGLPTLQEFLDQYSRSRDVVYSTKSKVESSIMYAGLGDALGVETEKDNRARVSWHHTLSVNGGIPIIQLLDVRLNQGYARYSDDTAMTKLVLQEMLVHNDTLIPLQKTLDRDPTIKSDAVNPIMGGIANAYMQDQHKSNGWGVGCRVPGAACTNAMPCLADSKKKDKDDISSWWDVSDKMKSQGGCGTVMRAHPWGLRFYKDPDFAAYLAAQESKITHGAPIARGGSAAMAAMVAFAVQNKSIDEIIQGGIDAAERYAPGAHGHVQYSYTSLVGMINAAKEQGAAAHKLLMDEKAQAFDELVHNFYQKHTGWGADSAVACAVFALMVHPDNPYKAVVMSVNSLGTDADSIASMAGALVGAYTGVPLPSDHVLGAKLEARDELEALADKLAAQAEAE